MQEKHKRNIGKNIITYANKQQTTKIKKIQKQNEYFQIIYPVKIETGILIKKVILK